MSETEGGRAPAFSQRHGYRPLDDRLQVESLNNQTRTDLWNVIIHDKFLDKETPPVSEEEIWAFHLTQKIDGYRPSYLRGQLNQKVFEGKWWEVYDLLEFLVRRTDPYLRPKLVEHINIVLAMNRAGCRVVDDSVVPVTDAEEVKSIELAANSTVANARIHIKNAVELFSDRGNSNFAKVIHEAMSGAEAAAQVLANKPGATLGDALSALQKNQTDLHPALLEGWKRLYGFTSDSGGIRHALKDGTDQPDQDLARYFLITCSAFVNWVTAVSSRAR